MDFTPVIDYIENVLRKEKGVPGCDVMIVREHETLLRYQSGCADYEGKKPVTPNDLYFMYSCSKVTTCAAAMQLVEKGVIQLDAPVSRYLPAFRETFLMKDGVKVPTQNTMTVRHLFTMSAGFNYDKDTPAIQKLIAQDPHAGTVAVINALAESPLQFEPGERFLYSMCHDVLAAVVEAASGMRFSDYLRQNIWEPLGMKRIGFALPEAERDNVAAQYRCTAPGVIEPAPKTCTFTVTDNYESGGGGLYSDVESYSLFADALANGGVGANGNRILKPETVDLMRTEQLSAFAVSTEFSCAAGPGYGYGLGVRTLIDRSGGQRSSIGEFGWDGAAGSYIMVDPAQKLSILFGMHVLNWPALIGCGHAPIRDLTYEVLGL